MVGDVFWDLIDRTRPPDPDPEVHAWKLTRALVDGGVDATVAFGHAFDEALAALDTWDLWGAGYLLFGGLSDDGFEYLRCWIVGQGRTAWEQARQDAEGYVVGLLAGIDDVDELAEHLVDLGIEEGEPLLYAAGSAHQELTGEWLPPHPLRAGGGVAGASPEATRPAGEPWEEDDDPTVRFPRLAAALPDGWHVLRADLFDAVADLTGAGEPIGVEDALVFQVRATAIAQALGAAGDAWMSGNHELVISLVEPVLGDEATWATLRAMDPGGLAVDLAYQGGISRLLVGDPDGAAEWLGLVADDPDATPEVRRGLAQIELSRGNLDAAERLLDTGPDASPMDLAIATRSASCLGDVDLVRQRAAATAAALARHPDLHPWDQAGANVQVGFALAEAGDAHAVAGAVDRVGSLTADAPPEVPLVAQRMILDAAAHRLAGDLDGAHERLGGAWDLLAPGTCDRGTAEREAARCRRAAGEDAADHWYERAIATFRAAGERWLADTTEAEAGRPGPGA